MHLFIFLIVVFDCSIVSHLECSQTEHNFVTWQDVKNNPDAALKEFARNGSEQLAGLIEEFDEYLKWQNQILTIEPYFVEQAVWWDNDKAMSKFIDWSRDDFNTAYIGGDYDDGVDTLMTLSARWGAIKIVKLLIKRGVKLNVTNRFFLTPVMVACRSFRAGCHEVLQELIQAKADLMLQSNPDGGETALQQAVKFGNFRAINILLQTVVNLSDGSIERSNSAKKNDDLD